jgi:peptidoglycan/xylan/chitin deacetylase (PgdA/CDA1 family)
MPASSAVSRPAVVPCSNGLVALTFDDGPDRELTPTLLDILESRNVPAVFFVNGGDVDRSPWVVRDARDRGFVVANHTYGHEQLTRLSAAGIRATLARTRRSIVAAGGRRSPLMRPPYGLIDPRVRAVVEDAGYVPVMWTVDPRDWEGDGPRTIASRVLEQLRPHRRNVVLQHDGIGNSPSSVAAVPRIVRRARTRGYCFASLDRRGRVRPPVPRVSVHAGAAAEGAGASATVTLRLDRPTSRTTSVLVRTVNGTAVADEDYQPLHRRVFLPAGSRRATVSVPVVDDARHESRETLVVRLREPRGLRIRQGRAVVVVDDDDPRPRLRILDASVTEPADGAHTAEVVLRLLEPSGRDVVAGVRTEPGTADAADFTAVAGQVVVPAGRLTGRVEVPVLADDLEEDVESFSVRVVEVRGARLVRGVATVWVLPPPS